jgi:lysophospholipase L1-like esterase
MKRIISLLLAGTMLVSIPVTAFAKPEKKVVDYVVLGDSLAAGQTPYRQIDSGYGEYIAKRFEQSQYKVKLDNYGVSGFTSTQLKNQLNTNNKIKEAIRNAEIITIDIGANDAL